MTGPANDFLDGKAVLRMLEDHRTGLLPAEVSIILQPFRSGQERGIDNRRADRGADRTHRRAHRVEEGTAGVLHQMPAIGDLCRGRQRCRSGQGVSSVAVACDDGDLRLIRKPRACGCGLAVGQ